MRVRIREKKIKFLNKSDRVEFWVKDKGLIRCKSYLMGRSPHYVLLKVPKIHKCLKRVQITVGVGLTLYGLDLEKNIKRAEDLMKILVRKRLAVFTKYDSAKKELGKYIEKIAAVNARYEVLRLKLDERWQEELSAVEADRIETLKELKFQERVLGEIHHKIEQYRVNDPGLEVDRWSLDYRYYKRSAL